MKPDGPIVDLFLKWEKPNCLVLHVLAPRKSNLCLLKKIGKQLLFQNGRFRASFSEKKIVEFETRP